MALRVCDIDFLRRRIELHRNAVRVVTAFIVGTLKSDKTRTIALPAFVIDELAATCRGQGPRRADLAVSHRRVPRATVVDRVMALRGGGSLPEGRPESSRG